MFVITKRFINGILMGMTIEETTSVRFRVGFKCPRPCAGSGYEITAVREATPEEISVRQRKMLDLLDLVRREG